MLERAKNIILELFLVGPTQYSIWSALNQNEKHDGGILIRLLNPEIFKTQVNHIKANIFSIKGIPSTPQHTDSNPCTLAAAPRLQNTWESGCGRKNTPDNTGMEIPKQFLVHISLIISP